MQIGLLILLTGTHNHEDRDDRIEMTRNQVYGTLITGQVAQDEIKNQLDKGKLMTINRVNEGNPNPLDEINDSYDYI